MVLMLHPKWLCSKASQYRNMKEGVSVCGDRQRGGAVMSLVLSV